LAPGGGGPVDRRKFLAAGAATAAVAAGSAVGGQLLTGRRFNANASRAAVKLASPAAKPPVLPKGAELNIPGLSTFYTPNSTFYRVDTALVIPQVTTQQWSLRIHGMVGQELNISFSDLIHMPMVERDITIMCVSDTVGGGYIGNARWQGVLLSDVLRQARVKSGVSQLAMTDVNGMTVGAATDVALDGRDTMLAVGMNGAPLPQEHGFPVRLIVPGLYGYCSATKWLTDMEITTLGAFDAYWVHRGWSQVGPTKTESRIDTPSPFHGSVKAGTVTVAGVAWAQHRGVEQVEVRFDGGEWTKATLAAQDTVDTWRQWYLPWQATTGQHTLEVRATDQTGYTQTPVNVGTFPKRGDHPGSRSQRSADGAPWRSCPSASVPRRISGGRMIRPRLIMQVAAQEGQLGLDGALVAAQERLVVATGQVDQLGAGRALRRPDGGPGQR
jgi:DMSO/TMAO reductase YedYZ molybdopterin-dependent catalytic subunit